MPATRKGPPPRSKIIDGRAASSPSARARASPLWTTLETYAREHSQQFVQRLLEEEVDALLGRATATASRGSSR